jgi:epoxyqueuosine reductase
MIASDAIVSCALDLGFSVAGVASAAPVPSLPAYRSWLAHGYHAEMGYLARPDRVSRRENPEEILPGIRSIICVGLNYYPGSVEASIAQDPSRGLISRYAWGADYHDLMQGRLEELAELVVRETRATVSYRCYVDTGPILERAYAAQAGLGFVGKNTCLISPKLGSWLFLGEIAVDVELAPTPGTGAGGCGSCRRCLDVCPTGALVAPYVLDARRCISYLTIELKASIPLDLRPMLGNRIFGCDVCQEACPWQRFAQTTDEASFRAAQEDDAAPRLDDVIGLSPEAFRARFAGRAVLRARRRGTLRNVAVALGNWAYPGAVDPLTRALDDPEPLVREHATWALDQVSRRGPP